jgi:ABC-type spermidine/putrescine transport system permease subunit I
MVFFGRIWRIILFAAVMLPFLISVLVRTYSWMIILGRFGVINNFLKWIGLIHTPMELMYNRIGVFIGLTYVLLPYAVLPMHSIMSGIDRDLLRAADSLGSTPLQKFYRIFLPLSFPGVAAGYLLSFIIGVGAFITPALMGGSKDTVIAISIDSQLEMVNNWGFASALSIVLLLTVLLLFSVCLRFTGMDALFGGLAGKVQPPDYDTASDYDVSTIICKRSLPGRMAHAVAKKLSDFFLSGVKNLSLFTHAVAKRFSKQFECVCLFYTRHIHLTGEFLNNRLLDILHIELWTRWALFCFIAVIAVFLFFPLFVIIPIAFSGDRILRFPPQSMGLGLIKSFFSSDMWIRASLNSLYTATLVTILSTILGTLAAMGLVRDRMPGRQFLYGLFISPIILPAIVNAVAIYFFIAKLKLIGTITGLTLAHTVLATPYVIIVMTTTLQGVDVNMKQASHSLGAGWIQTFFYVTLPLIKPGLLTAGIFAFIASFDELITALFISGARSATLPKQMWDGIRDSMDPVIAAVVALLIIMAVIIMALIEIIKQHHRKRLSKGI